MSEKINNKFGEIGTIRDILMGQQMHEYEERFNEIKKLVAALEKDLAKALDTQDSKFSELLGKMEKESSSRFEKLEKMLEKNVQAIYQKMEDNRQMDKHKLGKMFSKIGEQLTENGKQ